MAHAYDVVVIGSGFGEAITSALAAKGYRVLVLERGRRWTTDTYPASPMTLDVGSGQPADRHGWFASLLTEHGRRAGRRRVADRWSTRTSRSAPKRHLQSGWRRLPTAN
jgi:choline dehydrogenase-like flavoprotein